MKKLIFISLFAIPLCKAADDKPPSGWKRFVSKFKKDGTKKKEDAEKTDTESLDLSGQQLVAFPTKEKLSPKLTHLNLNDNQIRSVPFNLEFYLEELRSLSLANNLLEAIPYDMSKLQYLDLRNNKITEILAAIFHNSELVELNLSNNQLKYFTSEILEQTPQLQFLDLRGNPLNEKNIEELKKAAEKRGIELLTGEFEVSNVKPARKQ